MTSLGHGGRAEEKVAIEAILHRSGHRRSHFSRSETGNYRTGLCRWLCLTPYVQGVLYHDVDKGEACFACEECPGFELHFWRKVTISTVFLDHRILAQSALD